MLPMIKDRSLPTGPAGSHYARPPPSYAVTASWPWRRWVQGCCAGRGGWAQRCCAEQYGLNPTEIVAWRSRRLGMSTEPLKSLDIITVVVVAVGGIIMHKEWIMILVIDGERSMSVRPWRQHWQYHISHVTAVPGVYTIFIPRIAQTPLVIYHNPVTVVRMWTCDRSWLNHLVKHTLCDHTLAFLGILPFACPQSPPSIRRFATL